MAGMFATARCRTEWSLLWEAHDREGHERTQYFRGTIENPFRICIVGCAVTLEIMIFHESNMSHWRCKQLEHCDISRRK